jgi:hypothetical protein
VLIDKLVHNMHDVPDRDKSYSFTYFINDEASG